MTWSLDHIKGWPLARATNAITRRHMQDRGPRTINYYNNHNPTHSTRDTEYVAESTDVLDFEYTVYAIKGASSSPRPGRVDRSKLPRRRRGPGSLKQSSKGYLAFERWNGNSSILQHADDQLVEGARNLETKPCTSGMGAREPAANPNDEALSQHLEALLHRQHATPRAIQQFPLFSPSIKGQNHPSIADSGTELGRPGSTSTAMRVSVMNTIMRVGLEQRSNSSGKMMMLTTPARRRDESSMQAEASSLGAPSLSRRLGFSAEERSCAETSYVSRVMPQRIERGTFSEASRSSTSSNDECLQRLTEAGIQGQSDRPPMRQEAGRSSSAESFYKSHRGPWLEGGGPGKGSERNEEAEGDAYESSSKSSSAIIQARLVGGSHALGLNPRKAASEPVLKEALQTHEPQEVKCCVNALRRCLGGMSLKRAAAIVRADPRLIDLTERDMLLRRQELLVFVALFPPPRPRHQRNKEANLSSNQQPDEARQPGPVHTPPSGRPSPLIDAPLLPGDLIELLPEVVALVEATPQLLTVPADLCRVVAALMRLLGGQDGDEASVVADKVQSAVAMMLYRRPLLLTHRQQRPHRGRDIPPALFDHDLQGESGVIPSARGSSPTPEDAPGSDYCGYLKGFKAIIQVLQTRLGMERSQALNLVRKEPSILGLMPGALHASASALTSRPFQLETDVLREVVEFNPELLCMSPGLLKVTCKRLHSLLTRSPAWSLQLHRLISNPRNLAVALSFETSRYERLEYLVTTQRDRGISYKQALTMPEDEFHEMYAGFQEHRRQKGMKRQSLI